MSDIIPVVNADKEQSEKGNNLITNIVGKVDDLISYSVNTHYGHITLVLLAASLK